MRFTQLSPRALLIELNSGDRVLLSYGQPVAVYLHKRDEYLKVAGYISDTTTRHIKEFMGHESPPKRATNLTAPEFRRLVALIDEVNAETSRAMG